MADVDANDAVASSCCPTLVAEFDCENLDLDRHTSKGDLAWVRAFGHDSNRCITSWKGFLTFRVVNALIMFVTLLGSAVDQEVNHEGLEYYFIYLTNWTLIAQNVYLVLAVYVTYTLKEMVEAGESGTGLDMPSHVKLLWLLQGYSHRRTPTLAPTIALNPPLQCRRPRTGHLSGLPPLLGPRL